MGTRKRGAFDLKKAGTLAKSPRRPRLAQAQASLSEGGPFQRHLGNTFDKWLHAGAGRADPAPGPLLGSPPQVPGHRTSWRVRMCARPHIPAWRPRDPPPAAPAQLCQPEPCGASGPLGWEGLGFPGVAIWKHARVERKAPPPALGAARLHPVTCGLWASELRTGP
ncbi:unnamed protein product [Rangifer tarandus platyrhynchus]|uniref:Uncharacterized protein n=2 Tax=Rangifer tarandus platyrhynchus TaxID=3082113 RepID=A0ABN8Z3T5_RANTA|nr:unnamed protein product [Rangifer tarandus platyrhynchus]CAI9704975.1 unnamed protein product [Rangifer tarandus platyrhynchus]